MNVVSPDRLVRSSDNGRTISVISMKLPNLVEGLFRFRKNAGMLKLDILIHRRRGRCRKRRSRASQRKVVKSFLPHQSLLCISSRRHFFARHHRESDANYSDNGPFIRKTHMKTADNEAEIRDRDMMYLRFPLRNLSFDWNAKPRIRHAIHTNSCIL